MKRPERRKKSRRKQQNSFRPVRNEKKRCFMILRETGKNTQVSCWGESCHSAHRNNVNNNNNIFSRKIRMEKGKLVHTHSGLHHFSTQNNTVTLPSKVLVLSALIDSLSIRNWLLEWSQVFFFLAVSFLFLSRK